MSLYSIRIILPIQVKIFYNKIWFYDTVGWWSLARLLFIFLYCLRPNIKVCSELRPELCIIIKCLANHIKVFIMLVKSQRHDQCQGKHKNCAWHLIELLQPEVAQTAICFPWSLWVRYDISQRSRHRR